MLLMSLLLSLPSFVDRTASLGLSIAGGACWADVNNDGFPDLCSGGKVWRNDQGKAFKAIGEVGNSVAADYDNDGFADLFSWSEQKLYHNNGGVGFTAVALDNIPRTVSRGACWGDFDGDGFVDLYVGGFEDWDKGITYSSFILKNKGGKAFTLGWTEARYRTRGVTACDFDQDFDLDVYASNYRLQPNLLWTNDGKGFFADGATERNALATSEGFPGGHSIGAAWGDFDNDGIFDLFAGNFAHVDSRGDQPKSRFLRGLGLKGAWKLEDIGPCGVFYQESYACPAAGDFDNDGDLDLFFTTVYPIASFNKPNFPVLFRNDGAFKFTDATAEAGLAQLDATYQAAWADYDGDGDLDLLTAGKLFENQGNALDWVEFRLKGDGKKVNRSAIGAQIRIRIGGKTLTRQVESGTGEGNQNDLQLHFGLGDHSGAVTADILWPNGRQQVIRRVKTKRVVTVEYKN